MSNHSAIYCKTLNRVTKAELVNAVHQLTLQLRANARQLVGKVGPGHSETKALEPLARLQA